MFGFFGGGNGPANRAGMPSVESAGDGGAEGAVTRIIDQHADPRDRLQQGPLASDAQDEQERQAQFCEPRQHKQNHTAAREGAQAEATQRRSLGFFGKRGGVEPAADGTGSGVKCQRERAWFFGKWSFGFGKRRDNVRRMKLHRVAWAAGLVGLPLAHYWLVARVEPFYSSIYCFLWWSYIFAVDFAVCRLRGSSLLRDQPREFLVLAGWSIPAWLLFEMVNLRIHNWYYVMAPTGLWGMMFLFVAFATVLPGVFETTALVLGLIEKFVPGGQLRGRPFSISRANVIGQCALGVLMLALTLIFPKTCFCLAWGFAYFLTDPICFWRWRREKNHAGRSLAGQLAAGDNTRLAALLIGGFICGGLWEGWNLWARTKWIYSVPFFDRLKLGEMPLLGFMGFPPFALECYTMLNFLGLWRDGRNWDRPAADNHARRGMKGWLEALLASVVPLATVAAGAAVILGGTVASISIPLDRFFAEELGPAGRQALEERHAVEGDEFLRLESRPATISPELWERMRRLTVMGELKGMGLWNARGLEEIGVNTPAQLASQNADKIYQGLRSVNRRVRPEEVKVWVRAAKREVK